MVRRALTLTGIGFLITLIRAMLQLVIPAGGQAVLPPSLIVERGLLPIAFMIYGTVTYTALAVGFSLLQPTLSGSKRLKGNLFGGLLALMWAAYLLEPLPNVSPLDTLWYPLADGMALLLLGVLLGRFIATDSPSRVYRPTARSMMGVLVTAVCFAGGRLLAYSGLESYASFGRAPMATLAWVIGTGLVIGVVLEYIGKRMTLGDRRLEPVVLGLGLFGINLFFFNFFVPLVFAVDIADLLVRTAIDTASVTLGCYVLRVIPVGYQKQASRSE
ncbi:MAG TPA: hypothetical protein VK464_27325 [Symbiobacteriaceae bacterium]|jgi:hypothetical protein|nr:hypothetical protein [Symbiobacteriaceae bacterium]